MNTLLETPYQLLREHPEDGLYVHYWTCLTEELNQADMQREIALMQKAMQGSRPTCRYLYTDTTDFVLTRKTLAEWLVQELIPALYLAGIRKHAVLLPESQSPTPESRVLSYQTGRLFPSYHILLFENLKDIARWLVELEPPSRASPMVSGMPLG